MESQPQNPEIKNNPENFHPYFADAFLKLLFTKKYFYHCQSLIHYTMITLTKPLYRCFQNF